MAEELITIELEGREELNGEVRLVDFIAELNALRVALGRTQEEITQETNIVDYRVAGLSYASPYKVTIGIRSTIPSHAQTPRRIARRLTTSLDAVRRNHRFAQRVASETLESFKALASPVNTKIKWVNVYTPGKPQIRLDQEFARNLHELTETTYTERDEIAGRLEQVNIHNRNQFHIYPLVGAKRIFCKASIRFRGQIISNVGRRVRVEGKAHYRRDAHHPHEMTVSNIIDMPSDDELPKMSDLFGIAPNATDGATPEDFIRKLRDEW